MIPTLYVYTGITGDNRYRIIEDITGPKSEIPGADRTVNTASVGSGMLTRIHFPTGGWQEIDYEPNQYKIASGQLVNGGGVRVKEVRFQEESSPDPSKDVTRQYEYNAGQLIHYPIFGREIAFTQKPTWITSHNYDETTLTGGTEILLAPLTLSTDQDWKLFTQRFTKSYTPLSAENGGAVHYKEITVIHTGDGEEGGKTFYQYHDARTHQTHGNPIQSTNGVFYEQIRYMMNATYFPSQDDWSVVTTEQFGESYDISTPSSNDYHLGEIQFSGTNIFPYPPLSEDYLIPYEKLKKATVYKWDALSASYKEVQETSYSYQPVYRVPQNGELYQAQPFEVKGLVYGNHQTFDDRSNQDHEFSIRASSPKAWSSYTHLTQTGWKVIQEVETTFDQEVGLASTAIDKSVEYAYGSTNHVYLTEIKEKEATDTYVVQKLIYPLDLGGEVSGSGLPASTQAHNTMLEKRMLSTPVERQVWRTESGQSYFLGGQLSKYEILSGTATIVKPVEIWISELANVIPENNFVSSSISTTGLTHDPAYQQRQLLTYDATGRVLSEQVVGGEGTFTSYLYESDTDTYVAQVSSAAADQVAYTSFENDNAGNWTFTGTPTGSDAKTGEQAFALNASGVACAVSGGQYLLSFWAKSAAFGVSGGGVATPASGSLTDADGWTYYSYQYDLPGGGTIGIGYTGTNVLLDEIRLHPIDAQMNTYYYDDRLRLRTINDLRNQTIDYEYDGLGRLIEVRDQDESIIQRLDYHFKTP